MRTPRFYVAPGRLAAAAPGEAVRLPPDAARHATRVLKLREGDPLVLFDGTAGEYRAVLRRSGAGVEAVLGAHATPQTESPCRIALILGLARSQRMDYAIQKTVELGVSEIFPATTERSVVKLERARARRRLEHWRRIALGACEQSGRTVLPAVHEPAALPELLAALGAPRPGEPRIYLDPGGPALGARRPGERPAAATVAVGPEGGFTAAEEARLAAAAFAPLGLGPRILRAETAAAAAVLTLQLRWGDMAQPAGAAE